MLGPLFIDIEGVELNAEDREILQHPLVGGVIYFTRNFESREQIAELTRNIKALRQPELLVAIDHEGGRVQRFRQQFTTLPAVRAIGRAYDSNHDAGLYYAQMHGWLMAAELRAVGIDFSFAPVLDLDYGRSRVIGDRAFHHDAGVVSHIARQYIKGMNIAGMAATGKHFPGHGWAREDSHVAIPRDERDYESILMNDIIPYNELFQDMLAAIMPAHVIYDKVDPLPACFSRRWLEEDLRKKTGFDGLIISDDLSMQGASIVAEGIPDRARAALSAGCDMVLICNNRPAVIETLNQLDYISTTDLQSRLDELRGKSTAVIDNASMDDGYRKARAAVEELNRILD